MRPILYATSILAVTALAFWAYREGYDTRTTARSVRQLEDEIGGAREELSMLRAEWTYLNRPDRLRALAEMNFERLGLMPLRAAHFGTVEQVVLPLPAPTFPDDLAGVDAASDGAMPPLADDGEQLP